jgi:hypothetical protein
MIYPISYSLKYPPEYLAKRLVVEAFNKQVSSGVNTEGLSKVHQKKAYGGVMAPITRKLVSI